MRGQNIVKEWQDETLLEILTENNFDFIKIAQSIKRLKELDSEEKCISKVASGKEGLENPERKTIRPYFNYLQEKDIIERNGRGKYNRKLYRFTPKGEILANRTSKLFQPLSEERNLEKEILDFRSKYDREPSTEELSNLLDSDIKEEDIFQQTELIYNYEEIDEPREDIRKKIVAAFLVANTSAADANIDEEGVITEPEERNESEVLDYKYRNREFLEKLSLEHEKGDLFEIRLHVEANYVLDTETIKYRYWESEAIEKEELMELAD